MADWYYEGLQERQALAGYGEVTSACQSLLRVGVLY